MEKVIIIILVLVFGPVLVGAAWPGFVALLTYIFWFFVAIGAVAGAVVLCRKLIIVTEQEKLLEDQRAAHQAKQRSEHAELEALYSQVRNAYHNIFDSERARSQPRIGQ